MSNLDIDKPWTWLDLRGMATNDTPRHPIGVAAERTGLTADVIRVWERRYGVVEPARNAAGQRVYSDADVERLRLLRRATDGGRSIGQVASLDPESLAELVREDEAARLRAPGTGGVPGGRGAPGPGGAGGAGGPAFESVDVAGLMERAVRLDGAGLESALRRHLSELGFAGFAEGVAAPLLRRLGDAWHAGKATAAQEHLGTVAVRRVLESVRQGEGEGPTVVVATLSGERHEAGALMAAAAAELAGWRVVYLGPDLPVADVVAAAAATGARAVCASTVYAPEGADVVERFRALRLALPDGVALFAGGAAAADLLEPLERLGVLCPGGIGELRAALAERRAVEEGRRE